MTFLILSPLCPIPGYHFFWGGSKVLCVGGLEPWSAKRHRLKTAAAQGNQDLIQRLPNSRRVVYLLNYCLALLTRCFRSLVHVGCYQKKPNWVFLPAYLT